RRAVLYLAFFPMALFLQAVYSESLYMLLTLAAFVLAERGRWLETGLVAGLALLTRSAGLALLPPLLLLAWRSPHRPRAISSLAAAPGFSAFFPPGLCRQTGDAGGFRRSQAFWPRPLPPGGRLGGLWDGLRAGWAGSSSWSP